MKKLKPKRKNKTSIRRYYLWAGVALAIVVLSVGVYLKQKDNTKPGWQLVTNSPGWEARTGHCSVVFDHKLWVIGGSISNPDTSGGHLSVPGALNKASNESWHTEDGAKWEKAGEGTLPPFANCSMVEFKGKLWAVVRSAWPARNSIWSSENGIDWTKASDKPGWSMDAGYTMTVFRDKIWVIGGADADIFKNEVWYSEDGTKWTKSPSKSPWPARQSHSTVVFDNKIWLMGGLVDAPGNPGAVLAANDVWYSSDGITWVKNPGESKWQGASSHETLVYNGRMWIIGGYGHREPQLGTRKLNEVLYSTDGKQWTKDTKPIPWHANEGYSSAVFNNHIWVMGGYSDDLDGPKLSDVWRYTQDK